MVFTYVAEEMAIARRHMDESVRDYVLMLGMVGVIVLS